MINCSQEHNPLITFLKGAIYNVLSISTFYTRNSDILKTRDC